MLLRAFLARYGRADLRVSFRFMTALIHYDWPYNVRELEACVKRALTLADGAELDAPLLPDHVRDEMADYGSPLPKMTTQDGEGAELRTAAPSEVELRRLLETHCGNVAAVGRALGKARMQIHRWIVRYGIDLGDYRA
jgi:DNA-binding NtrC family response regulator